MPSVTPVVSRIPSARAGSIVVRYLPGLVVVALTWALIGPLRLRVPTTMGVALLLAAVGAGALWGGFGPAFATGASALLASWGLALPVNVFLLAAFALGAFILGFAGESLQRSEREAGALAAELAVTRRRLVHESADREQAERAAAALRLVQERFERLVDSSVVPVVVTDDEERFIQANPAFLTLVGFPAHALTDADMRWRMLALPAEWSLDERAASEARAHGAAPPYEKTLVCADGRRVPVLVGALAIAPGESELLWFIIDLSAGVRLEEERAERALLDVIFETAPVGLGLYDRDFRFLRLNRRLAEINGLPPEQQIGRRVPDVLPDLGPEVRDAFAQVIRTGEPIERAETHGRTPASHEVRHWETSYYPVRTGDGPLFGIAALVNEVTERRRAEAERETLLREAHQARAEAESASRAKDEFLAILSHELRAPLQGVLGWVSLLRDGRLDTEQSARALRSIERSTKRQTQIVNDLLDVSRIITGTLIVESHPVDLAALIGDAIDEIGPVAAARGIALQSSVSDCGITVGDPQRLRQVLSNLLSNALKFTSAGGTVTVRCAQSGDGVALSVSDTGEGITAEFLPHVFEHFRQADSSSSRRHGGLGLGLAIAQRLVELHGGRITAESAGVGCGATFSVQLPLGGSARCDAEARGARAPGAPPQHDEA